MGVLQMSRIYFEIMKDIDTFECVELLIEELFGL